MLKVVSVVIRGGRHEGAPPPEDAEAYTVSWFT